MSEWLVSKHGVAKVYAAYTVYVTQIKADQTQNLAYDNWYAIWLINFNNIYLLQELP